MGKILKALTLTAKEFMNWYTLGLIVLVVAIYWYRKHRKKRPRPGLAILFGDVPSADQNVRFSDETSKLQKFWDDYWWIFAVTWMLFAFWWAFESNYKLL